MMRDEKARCLNIGQVNANEDKDDIKDSNLLREQNQNHNKKSDQGACDLNYPLFPGWEQIERDSWNSIKVGQLSTLLNISEPREGKTR